MTILMGLQKLYCFGVTSKLFQPFTIYFAFFFFPLLGLPENQCLALTKKKVSSKQHGAAKIFTLISAKLIQFCPL